MSKTEKASAEAFMAFTQMFTPYYMTLKSLYKTYVSTHAGDDDVCAFMDFCQERRTDFDRVAYCYQLYRSI